MVVDQRALNLHTKLVEDAVKQGEYDMGSSHFPKQVFTGKDLKKSMFGPSVMYPVPGCVLMTGCFIPKLRTILL